MKCPTCQTELNEQTIEDRKRTTCPSCSYMHYEPRKVTGAYYEFVDDIADDVASKGCCEMMTVALRNVCFPKDGDFIWRVGASFMDLVLRCFMEKMPTASSSSLSALLANAKLCL